MTRKNWLLMGALALGGGLTGCGQRVAVPDPEVPSCEGAACDTLPPVHVRDTPPPPPVDTANLPSGDKMGMTWQLHERFEDAGAVTVGCAPSGPYPCNPYSGDTRCDTALPLLCFRDLSAPRPAGVDEPSQYYLWSGGEVRLTRPYAPSERIARIGDADALCASAFGHEWRLATFHDGWGWNFSAFGELAEIEPQSDRVWLDISDQSNGTCWRR
jgi:hypothetical protein